MSFKLDVPKHLLRVNGGCFKKGNIIQIDSVEFIVIAEPKKYSKFFNFITFNLFKNNHYIVKVKP